MNQQTLITVGTWIVAHWPQIIAYSINGLSIAVILQWLKKKYKLDEVGRFQFLKVIHLDGPRIVAVLFSVFTAVSTGASWLADPANAQYIPERYALILAAGLYIHRFLVSPLAIRIETSLEPYFLAVEQIKATSKEQAPSVPAATTAPAPSSVL